MTKETYLEILKEQIRCKKALPLATRELEAHIEDQITDYMAQGMPRSDAEKETIRQMGDPVEVGIEMDRIHRPKMAWGMIGWIVLLSLLGTCLLYALQIRFEDQNVRFFPELGIPYILSYLLKLLVGFGIMIGICYIDYSRIGKHAKKIMAIYVLSLIVLNLGFGVTINGASNWISLPGGVIITLSPMIFLTVPLYGAVLYQYRGWGYRGVAAGILWMIVPVLFVLRIPLLSQASLLSLSFLIVLSAAILKGWFRLKKKLTLAVLWGTAILAPLAGCAKLMISGPEYQKDRLYSMLPSILQRTASDSMPQDYQLLTLKELTARSRILGANEALGHASDPLPNSADYILAYVLAYYGILAAALLIGAIIFLFLRFLKISIRQKNQPGMLMGTGCTVFFLLQITIDVMVNLGWIPGASVYCPFISYGGTGMLVTYMMLGLLLSIYRYQNVLTEQKPCFLASITATGTMLHD